MTAGTDAVEMLEKFKAAPADFDLVMTDLAMPVMTGVEFTMEVRKIRSDIPVVITTGFASGLTHERAGEMGIKDILMKPMSRGELGNAIRRVFDASSGG